MSKSKDAFRTISEVSDWLGTQAHVLRFWESKFDQLVPTTNITEIEEILNKQLEVIRQNISNISKQEALSLLAKTQTALSRQVKAIDRESNQLQRINLLTVETEAEIKQAFKRVFKSTAGGIEAWTAVKYWQKSDKKLTWENLEKSTKKFFFLKSSIM